VNNVVCEKEGPRQYCPVNADLQHFKDQNNKPVAMCVFPGGEMENAAESMPQCQDPGNWSTENVNQYTFPQT
jgi:hypothetical protein